MLISFRYSILFPHFLYNYLQLGGRLSTTNWEYVVRTREALDPRACSGPCSACGEDVVTDRLF